MVNLGYSKFFNYVRKNRKINIYKDTILFIFINCLLSNLLAVPSETKLSESKQFQNCEKKLLRDSFGKLHPNVNDSDGCFLVRNNLLSNVDPNVNPCIDFYRFACGRFINQYEIPSYSNIISTETTFQKAQMEALKNYMSEQRKDSDTNVVVAVKQFYRTCLVKHSFSKQSLYFLNSVLNIKESWPAVKGQSWQYPLFSWTEYTIQYSALGFDTNYFINLYTSPDYLDTSKHIVHIEQAKFIIPRKYLLMGDSHRIFRHYKMYIQNIAELFGASPDTARRGADDIVAIEIELAKAAVNKRELLIIRKKRTTIGKLKEECNAVNWLRYINVNFGKYGNLTYNDEVLVSDTQYFKQLSYVLKLKSRKTLANYVLWRVIQQTLPFLTTKFKTVHYAFMNEVNGRRDKIPFGEECVYMTNHYLPIPVAALYANKAQKIQFNQTYVKEIIKNIKLVFREYTLQQHNTWINDTLTPIALEKIKSIRFNLNVPSKLTNDSLLGNYYGKICLDFNSTLQLAMCQNCQKRRFYFDGYNNRYNRTSWIDPDNLLFTKPSYDPFQNIINIPFRYFDTIYYSDSYPDYMNYGAFGAILGHQITHAIDKVGANYVVKGDDIKWWDSLTESQYINQSNCYISQYNQFTNEDAKLFVNGERTARENMADALGLQVAYYAYRRYGDKYVKVTTRCVNRLTEYNKRELFWISYANMFCSKYNEFKNAELFFDDYHAPPVYRVIGQFVNIEDFREDFSCQLENLQYPKYPCRI